MIKRSVKILLGIFLVLFFLQQATISSGQAEKTELLASEKYFEKVYSLLNSASKSVFVAMYIFRHYPDSPSSPSNLLVQSLIKAKQRGANVQVLLDISDRDEPNTKENKKTGELLSKNGVEVRYDNRAKLMHAKIVVVDSRYTIIGSHNWSYHGLTKNNELSIFIDSPDLAKEAQEYIMELTKGK